MKETVRSTVEQNLVLRWVSESDLPALYTELKHAGLATPVAGTIVDVASCPGTDTCKLGIASSRGLAGELRMRLARKKRGTRRSHSADCGSRSAAASIPAASIMWPIWAFTASAATRTATRCRISRLCWAASGATTRAPMGLRSARCLPNGFPKRWIAITERYPPERLQDETFQAFIKRIGKAECKKMIDEFTAVPPHEVDASFYSDWGDPREFSIGDIGVGECAGEVVFPIDFELVACEREAFEAQLNLESGNIDKAAQMAYESMLHGALALLKFKFTIAPEDPDKIVAEFRTHFYDTEMFFDPFVRGKFAQDFFSAHEEAGEPRTRRNGSPADRRSAVVYRGMPQLLCAPLGRAGEGHRVMTRTLCSISIVKIFVEDGGAIDLADAVPVFHQWIRDQRLSGNAHRCRGLPPCARGSGRAADRA